MFVLIIGIVVFFGVHLIPLTSAKFNLVERMGEKKYQGVFSIFSLIGLIVMIYGFSLVDDCNPMMANCNTCLLYTSPSPRDGLLSRMPSSA